jgi:hypothetical protein
MGRQTRGELPGDYAAARAGVHLRPGAGGEWQAAYTDGMEWWLPGEAESFDPVEVGPAIEPPRQGGAICARPPPGTS